jgi:hypothetical protein
MLKDMKNGTNLPEAMLHYMYLGIAPKEVPD